MRKRDLRAQRAAKRDLWTTADTEPVEIPDEPDDDHDGYSPIREREPIPMREGPAIDPRAPWQFPT